MLNEKQKFNAIMRLGVEFADVKDVFVFLNGYLGRPVSKHLER